MKKKGILKSDKFLRMAVKACAVQIGAVVLAALSAIPLGIVAGVYGEPVDRMQYEIKASPTYIQYVQDKTEEYKEDLYLNKITPEEYMAKINDLSDIDAYLKSDAPEYEMAKYSELVERKNTAICGAGGTTFSFIVASAAAGFFALGALILSKSSEINEEDEESGAEEEEEDFDDLTETEYEF